MLWCKSLSFLQAANRLRSSSKARRTFLLQLGSGASRDHLSRVEVLRLPLGRARRPCPTLMVQWHRFYLALVSHWLAHHHETNWLSEALHKGLYKVLMEIRYILRFAGRPLATKDLLHSSSSFYRIKRLVDRLWALHPCCSTIFPRIIIHMTSRRNCGNPFLSPNFQEQSKMVLHGNGVQMEC